jgi:hypothetical protein
MRGIWDRHVLFGVLAYSSVALFGCGSASPESSGETSQSLCNQGSVNHDVAGNFAPVGTIVEWTATSLCDPGDAPAVYEFSHYFRLPDSGGISALEILQPFSLDPTFTWDTNGQPEALHVFRVVLQSPSSPEQSLHVFRSLQLGTPIPCSPPTVDLWSDEQPTPSGTIVSGWLGADCEFEEYRIELRGQDGEWQVLSDWGVDGSLNWNTEGLPGGTYELRVSVRSEGLPETEAQTTFTHELAGTCSGVSLTSFPLPSQGMVGDSMTFTAQANCGGTPEYAFYLLRPGATAWDLVDSYWIDGHWTFYTTGETPGEYRIQVWARNRQSGSGNAHAYEAWAGMVFVLDSRCNGAGISSNVTSPSAAGTDVTLSATASHCLDPEYLFWRQEPSGSWSVLQDWSASSEAVWDTDGATVGAHDFQVWVRRANQSVAYETWAGYRHAISPD